MANILYLDSRIPFPRGTLFFPQLFCGLIVTLVFLNLFPSPLLFSWPAQNGVLQV